jgi:hypothetical protein
MRFMMLMIPKGKVQEFDEFPEDVKNAAAGFSEMQDKKGAAGGQ